MSLRAVVRCACFSLLISLAFVSTEFRSSAQEEAPGGVREAAFAEQAIDSDVARSRFFGDVQLPGLPSGADWILQLNRRGGIAGIDEELILDSSGTLVCHRAIASCPDSILPPALETLTRQVAGARSAPWVSRMHPLCSDCLNHLLVLVVRNPDGTATRYSAYWNLTPGSGARDFYDAVRRVLFP
jgi:hypothetical protein